MNNEFNNGITNEDMEGIDDIVDASNINNEVTEKSNTNESIHIEDSGIIDINSSNFDDIGTYKPVSGDADKKRLQNIISQNLSYIATKDDNVFAKKRKAIEDEIEAYKKNLIINKGFTDEEATAAAEKRAEKRAIEEVNEYKTNNPEIAIIKVDKTDSDKIVIAPEDQAKVHKASAIRLVEVEDAELKHIKIKKHPSSMPISIAKLNTCNLTRFMIPCINTVDMCTFDGTSTLNLVNLYWSDNDTYKTRLIKQMDLIYDKFVSSTTKKKYSESGSLILTKDNFLNWFAYADLTAALYAIYVASSTEIVTSKFDCQNELCVDVKDGKTERHKFDFAYNVKDLLKFDTEKMQDNFKEIYNGIIKNNNDVDKMLKFRDEKNVGHRYQSSITKNIYDIETPSCARALAFADFITDNAENQLSEVYYSIAIHIAKIYLYCGEEEGEAVYTEVTEPKDIYDIVSDAIEPEFNLYTQKLVANKSYTYETTLTYTCDKCGNEITTPIDIPSLVFLKAQRMGSGIE